jgi:hypothetical protein
LPHPDQPAANIFVPRHGRNGNLLRYLTLKETLNNAGIAGVMAATA